MRLTAWMCRFLAAAASAAAAAVALAAALPAHAQAPEIGGSVPSVLSLSLGRPSGFRAAGGGRGRQYVATVQVSLTATEMPTRLSIVDGETLGGARRGRLVAGGRSLSAALEAAAGRGPYRSLDSGVGLPLKQWDEPLAGQAVSIHLRQAYSGSAQSLRRFHKLLLVTVTAGGP